MPIAHISSILLYGFIVFHAADHASIQTEITKWQDGKEAAISLTYDDGSITQFRIALPMMNERGFPGTFFITTDKIPGSKYPPKFIGRPVDEIVRETGTIPTNKDNFFERAGATRFLDLQGVDDYQNRAGRLFERGQCEDAFQLIDDFYRKVRNGEFGRLRRTSASGVRAKYEQFTWDEARQIAADGHEFAVHTISHPYLPALDEANILYEIEKCKEDIEVNLGRKHTFSIEAPYGMKDERVLEYIYPRFPLVRNKVTDDYVEEILRGSREDPGASTKPYVQWQRGPHTDTSLRLMKQWVDTSIEHDVWLVLVFHGVEDVGWEPKTAEELRDYFNYIKSREDRVWIATYQDAGKYIRERMNGTVECSTTGDGIRVELAHSLDKDLYDLPLTLKTYFPQQWEHVQVEQGRQALEAAMKKDEKGVYVSYRAIPNSETITIREAK
ncbi:MAG: polysaccharide deacetylase family protein [Planctomycetota bacterium]|jgi:peptidoglycan/xylan/chitin deacetylase (PgdA/CDA1 family)